MAAWSIGWARPVRANRPGFGSVRTWCLAGRLWPVPRWIMGLFERLVRAFPPPRWMDPPAVVPGQLGDVLLLAHTDVAAVAVVGLAGYPTGFEFTLRLLLHREKPFGRRVEPSMEMHRWRGHSDPPSDFPRLSVQFADGTLISNLDRLPYDQPDVEPAKPLLVETPRGISGAQRTDLAYWVWRLPPPGPVTFTCRWPACRIDNARAHIDASRILDAAARSIDPWPGDP